MWRVSCVRWGRNVFSTALDPRFIPRSVVLRGFPPTWYTDDVRAFVDEALSYTDSSFDPRALLAGSVRGAPSRDALLSTEGNDEGVLTGGALDDAVHDVHIPVRPKTGVTMQVAYVRLRTALLARQLLSFEPPPDAPDDLVALTIEAYTPRDAPPAEGAKPALNPRPDEAGRLFTRVKRRAAAVGGAVGAEAEKRRVLQSGALLDRYLMSPDLLLDVDHMHQRRYVRPGERVLAEFASNNDVEGGGNDGFVKGEEAEGRGAGISDFHNPFGKLR